MCDTHIHVYDHHYPSSPGAVLHPADASVVDYRDVQRELGVARAVVVQPTTYGIDNSCQLDAMAAMHDAAPDHVRGVMVIDETVDDDEIRRMDELGVRGARFHMLPGGAVPWSKLAPVAERIAALGWHIQLQCNGRELAARHDELAALPTEVVIDHVGRFMPPVPPHEANFEALIDLAESERAWVKLSAPYESSLEPIHNDAETAADNHADVTALIDALVDRVPHRLVWASNWPHPGQDPAPTPATLRSQMHRWLPSPELRAAVMAINPHRLYFS
jgi:D-galactarolactone isomerase